MHFTDIRYLCEWLMALGLVAGIDENPIQLPYDIFVFYLRKCDALHCL